MIGVMIFHTLDLEYKSTNIIHGLSRAFLLIFKAGNFRRVWLILLYSRAIEITPEPAILFVIPDGIDIRVLPDLSDKISNDLYQYMGGLGLIFGFIHGELV